MSGTFITFTFPKIYRIFFGTSLTLNLFQVLCLELVIAYSKVTNSIRKMCKFITEYFLSKTLTFLKFLFFPGDVLFDIFKSKGSKIRFNDLRLRLIDSLDEKDLQNLKTSIEGTFL